MILDIFVRFLFFKEFESKARCLSLGYLAL